MRQERSMHLQRIQAICETRLVPVPEGQSDDVQMDANDEIDDIANDLPNLSVKIQPDDQERI